MCQECGCGLGDAREHHEHEPSRPHAHAAGHDHPHPDAAGHAHGHREDPSSGPRLIEIQRSLLDRNDRLAERNRGFFRAKKLLVLNVVSAPGSGKTSLIQKTAEWPGQPLRIGVIVGDLATDNDAARLRSAGLPVVQISTGTLCHLDAGMISRAMEQLDLESLDLLVIENVGNLVCPAAYDLGENLRVVLLSVTEGEDKPLKYPPLFHSANVAVITKSDLAGATGFDRAAALSNLRRISHHARILEVSARSGEGMAEWCAFLSEERERAGR